MAVTLEEIRARYLEAEKGLCSPGQKRASYLWVLGVSLLSNASASLFYYFLGPLLSIRYSLAYSALPILFFLVEQLIYLFYRLKKGDDDRYADKRSFALEVCLGGLFFLLVATLLTTYLPL